MTGRSPGRRGNARGLAPIPVHLEERYPRGGAAAPDDFDSEAEPQSDAVPSTEGQLLSDLALELDEGQADDDMPFGAAASDENSAALGDFLSSEPHRPIVDLRHGTIRSASLFDQPFADDEEPPDSQLELPIELNTRQPRVETDDPSDIDEARQNEIKRLFDVRVKKRLELERRRSSR